jgi:aspartate kinase
MALVVQKFGGSSVADIDRIRNVANIISESKKEGHRIVVVVSAMGKTTDSLISLSRQLTETPSEREMDMLMSTGEQISISLLAMALHAMNIEAVSFTGSQVGIRTDQSHMKARIISIESDRLMKALDDGNVVIVAGFQGTDIDDNITTLGRGGSDTTAVAIASAVKADVCDIYTDVDGVYTADPRVVPAARKLDFITYDEMLELASAGAKVMHSRSIEFAKKYGVVIQVRSSFETSRVGTFIQEEGGDMEDPIIRGVTADKNEAKISILGVQDVPGIAASLFSALAGENINVDVIIQNVSEHGITNISFTVPKSDLKHAIHVSEKVMKPIGAKGLTSDENIAKISVVGVGMRTHSGIAARMFGALSEKKINIQMISTSEIKISVVIDLEQADDAVRILHDVFELDQP